MRKKQQVTIYDIAERAKVSPATVSRVLHGSLNVSAHKRDAVLPLWEQHLLPGKLTSAVVRRPLRVVE